MENSLVDSVFKVCKILNTHSVEYLMVGGTAVALHGFYRLSHDPSGRVMQKHDLDFWYNPTYPNYYNLLDALEDLGVDVTELKDEQSPDPRKSFFQLERDDYKIDFLPEILGLSRFRPCFESAMVSPIYDIEVRSLNYDNLIKSKRALGRTKDVEDIEQLKLKRDDQA